MKRLAGVAILVVAGALIFQSCTGNSTCTGVNPAEQPGAAVECIQEDVQNTGEETGIIR